MGLVVTLDTLTVGYSVKAGERPRGFTRTDVTALALSSVADAAHDAHTQSLRVEAETDRLDLDVMEHHGQSRLRRWQEQR